MKTSLGTRWIKVWICGSISAILFVAPQAAAAHVPASQHPGAAVALGDSFVSGEAGRWLGNARGGGPSANGTDRFCIPRWWGCEVRPSGVYREGPTATCHRSDSAAIEVVSTPFTRRVNLACSGARARDIYLSADRGGAVGLPSQVDRLKSVAMQQRVTLVLISVGANDVGFSDLVSDCAEAWFSSRPGGCRRIGSAALADRLGFLRKQVDTALDSVVSAMDGAGYGRSDWDFVVHGYASPLPAAGQYRYPESSVRRLLPGGCPFTDADSDWADRVLVSVLNRELRRLAHDHDARFLDLAPAFDGHHVCDEGADLVDENGPSGARAEWFRFLVPCCGAEKRESLHPNAYGQRAIGSCLGLFLARRTGDWTCRNRPGLGPESMRLVESSR